MLGTPRIAFTETDSTNTQAKRLLREGAAEGTVVTAEHQTAGRGRLERSWVDQPAQALLASYIIYPERMPEEWGGIPLFAGLAVVDALRRLAPLDLHLKWPNDVLCNDAKLCGVLVESGVLGDAPWSVIGIGINVNQTRFEGDFRIPPTSLCLEAGRMFDTDEVLGSLSSALDARYVQWAKEGNGPIIDAWSAASRMLGMRVRIDDGHGSRRVRAVGLAPTGALLVENAQGLREELLAGDVTFAGADKDDEERP